MKKTVAVVLLLFILALSGCAVKEAAAFEYIECPVAPDQPMFYLSADIPSGAMLTASSNEGRSAVFLHEDFTVMEEIFPADSLDEALLYLTGQTAEALQPIQVAAFPQEEYRFAWTAAGEPESTVCSGTLFYDGSFFYALTVQCDAAVGKEYRTVFSDMLESATLEVV